MIIIQIRISYFYQIRNFKKNMIPVSTACWDPSWFHNFQNSDFTFLDKRGIVNGLRCEELHPDETCSNLCQGTENCNYKPEKCNFLQAYKKQLNKINFIDFMSRVKKSINKIAEQLELKEEPILVFIVYEAPNNPCSERQALLDWFNNNGIECKELDYPIEKIEIKKGDFEF